MQIDSIASLREVYAMPNERALKKQIAVLDIHCRNFIGLSPFLVLATTDAAHNTDASPRGGEPGFVKVTTSGELLIPDSPGNNRLDSLENIVATRKVGLLFLIPGFDETLRINGIATLSRSVEDIAACTTEKRAPKLVIRVAVEAAYLHCAKAFMRSKLWEASAQVDRSVMPTAGKMLSDQTGIVTVPETIEEMRRRYQPDL
ncbi:MAG: MSMEG_1061 family FMN-dependent PPOX-type flavoprotein [Ramlibacter sp.]